MMETYLISYDLKKPERDYAGLYDAIQGIGTWWHYLESTWLIKTDETPEQIWERLQRHIDKNDRLLIVGITSQHQGWLPKKAWDWINER